MHIHATTHKSNRKKQISGSKADSAKGSGLEFRFEGLGSGLGCRFEGLGFQGLLLRPLLLYDNI